MPAPANDLLANATVLTLNAAAISGTTIGATLETNEYAPVGGLAATYRGWFPHSVWYSWTPPSGYAGAMPTFIITPTGGSGEFIKALTYVGHVTGTGDTVDTITLDNLGGDSTTQFTVKTATTVANPQIVYLQVSNDSTGPTGLGTFNVQAIPYVNLATPAFPSPSPHATVAAALREAHPLATSVSGHGHATADLQPGVPAPLTADPMVGTSSVTANLHSGSGVAPANDNFANAESILLDVHYTGVFDNSTVEPTEYDNFPAPGGGNGPFYRSVIPFTRWYKYVVTSAGTIHADVTTTSTTDSVYLLSWIGNGTDTIDTVVSFSGIGGGSGGTDIPSSAGDVLYFEVGCTGEFSDFDFLASGGGTAVWAAVSHGTSAVTAALSENYSVSAAIAGHAQVTETLVLNSMFLTVHGTSNIPAAVASEDANPYVFPYLGDPPVGAGGTVTPATGPYTNLYNNDTAVAIIETIGAAGTDSRIVNQYLALYATDKHGADDPRDYILDPLDTASTTPIYTCERWFRVRFQYPFDYVDGLRLWSVTNTSDLLPGWTVKWGTTDTYATPTTGASSVATSSLPLSDPGSSSRNLMDSGPVTGLSSDYFSKWVVIQARFDPAVAGLGPFLGFTSEGAIPFALQLEVAWAES